MRISHKTNTTKKTWRIIFIASIALVALSAAGYLLYKNLHSSKTTDVATTRPQNTVSYDPPTTQEKQEASQIKQAVVDSSTATKPSDSPSPTPAKLYITIIRASQAKVGDPLNIRTQVDGTSTGICNFTLSKSGQTTISKQANIVFQATTSTCSLDVAATEFPQAGDWQLSTQTISGTSKSDIATQNVTITK